MAQHSVIHFALNTSHRIILLQTLHDLYHIPFHLISIDHLMGVEVASQISEKEEVIDSSLRSQETPRSTIDNQDMVGLVCSS